MPEPHTQPPSSDGISSCPDCSAPLAEGQRYCLSCGATLRDVLGDLLPVSAPAPEPAVRRAPLGGVRDRLPASWPRARGPHPRIPAFLAGAPAFLAGAIAAQRARLSRVPIPDRMRAALVSPLPGRDLLPVPGGAPGAAGALVCALAVGVIAGAFAGPASPGAASSARAVVVPMAPAASTSLPATRLPGGDLGSLQSPVPAADVPAPPAETAPEPTPSPSPPPPPSSPPPPPSPPPADAPAPETEKAPIEPAPEPVTSPPPVKHVVVVALSDKGFSEAFAPGSKAPYLATELRKQSLLLRRYHATAHGSLPNLTGLLSGQGANPDIAAGCPELAPFVVVGKPARDGQVRGKGCVFPASVPTLLAQLEAKKLMWRAYVEGSDPPPEAPPGPCQPPALAPDGSRPGVDRNPFLFFAAIAGAADCTTKVTGLGALAADLAIAPGQAPALSVILPNACNAGREGTCPPGEPDGIARADAWLRDWIPQLLGAPAYADDTMIVITFDQARAGGPASDSTSCCGRQRGLNEPASGDPQAPPDGGGRVGALVLSPRVTPGRVSNVAYNHFALLHTIERAFDLEVLGLAGAEGVEPFGDDVFGAAP